MIFYCQFDRKALFFNMFSNYSSVAIFRNYSIQVKRLITFHEYFIVKHEYLFILYA